MIFPRGGNGISPYGRAAYGNVKSDIEPRFFSSIPLDNQTSVHGATILYFTTYCFSSWIEDRTMRVEISEDGGVTYNTIYYTAFAPPYNGLHSKWYRLDSHQIRFVIEKNGKWNANSQIVIRFTGTDEFGQEATKTIPVTWG